VPFSHDQDFVSRDALLDQIKEKSSVPGSRIVLVGLGGVGSGNMGSKGGPFKANYTIGKHDLSSNTATEFVSNRPTPGSSGFMRVMRPAARKVCATLPTEPRFPGARTTTLIYFKSSATGYRTKESENGFSSWTMLTMTSFFANLQRPVQRAR
jgi:hypothetical protein